MRSAQWRGGVFVILLLAFATDVSSQTPRPASRPPVAGASPAAMGQIIVRVRGAGGASLSVFAVVRIFSNFTAFQQSSSTRDNSQAVFAGVPVGEYQIEVRAPGYEVANEEASLIMPDTATYVYVDLRPEAAPGAAAPPSGPPLLAPKAQKELEAAAAALRAGDLKQAKEHLDKLQKMAPGHPDVHYLQGLLYLRKENLALARASLERAVSLYPEHFGAQSTLGALLYGQAEYKAGIAALEKAVQLEPQSWQSHRTLALCYFREASFEKARAHVERALETSGNKAPELRIFLARVLIAMKQYEKAQEQIKAFVVSNPSHPDLPEANRLLDALHQEVSSARNSSGPSTSPTPAASPDSSADSRTGVSPPLASGSPASGSEPPAGVQPAGSGSRRWAPVAVDQGVPVLNSNAACSLDAVLAGAGRRAAALVANLERITAAEHVELADLDRDGNRRNIQTGQYNYVVSIIEVRPGILSVEENRRPMKPDTFSPRLLSRGLAALALILHPYYVRDFQMRCEGLTEWKGQAAWSVYFEQRPAPSKGFRVYTTNRGRFEVLMKGRAWIGANNFEILRLETDLLRPIKEIGLELDHLVIDYKPVQFKSREVRLWLPTSAQAYVQLAGRRHRLEHSFRDYMIFSVDVTHKQAENKLP